MNELPEIGIPDPIPYADALREQIRARLEAHQRRTVDVGERRHAAVAIVLTDSSPSHPVVLADEAPGIPATTQDMVYPGLEEAAGGTAFLLCQRPLWLKRHAGQFALPGGRLEPGENVHEAALRETHEEVGIDLPQESVLGVLDDYVTRSGFVMTPVVVWAGQVQIRPDPGEVMAVHRIGLHQLQRADSPIEDRIPESDRPVLSIPLGSTRVHAPTAAVLLQLNWLGLQGRSDSVQHYDQPLFAWR